MNTQTVKLTASDSKLTGKYTAEGIVLVLCDAAKAAFTVYLPDAKSEAGTLFVFKKTDSESNTVTIAARNAQTIDGDASKDLAAQYDHVTIISSKDNYQIVGAG